MSDESAPNGLGAGSLLAADGALLSPGKLRVAADLAIAGAAGWAVALGLRPTSWGLWLSTAALLLLGWLWSRRHRDSMPGTVWPFVLGVALMIVSLWGARFENLRGSVEAEVKVAEKSFRDQLEGLSTQASRVAGELEIPGDPEQLLADFLLLEQLYDRGRDSPASTLYLVDPDGKAVAWAGEGLRHDLRSSDLPASGVSFVSSFTAITLFAVAPIEPSRRPWRVVAGRSHSTAELPFANLHPTTPGEPAWSVRRYRSPDTGDGWIDLGGDGSPALRLPAAGAVLRRPLEWPVRVPWASFALAMIGVAIATAFAALESQQKSRMPALALAYAVLGLGGAGVGLGAHPAILICFLIGGLGVAWSWGWARPLTSPISSSLVAIAAAAGGIGIALLGQRWIGPVELGDRFWVDSSGWYLRAALTAIVAVGLIGSRRSNRRQEPWFWGAIGLVALAVACSERSALAASVLLLAAACAGRWRTGPRTGGELGRLMLLASLIAASLGHVGHRAELRSQLATMVETSSLGQQEERIHQFFDHLDLSELALGDPDRLTERIDLPLALWRASPLAASVGGSAVLLFPADGSEAGFSFGSVDTDLERAERGENGQPPRWSVLDQPPAAGEVIFGERPLMAQGKLWGVVRYWWAPPVAGPVSRSPWEGSDLARALLRTSPSELGLDILPGNARAVVGAPVSLGPIRGRWQRQDGAPSSAWRYFPSREDRGVPGASIELPIPTVLESLRKVGLQTVASYLALIALASVIVPLMLAVAASRRRLFRISSSYSRKLVLVFTLLLIVPGALLNLFLLRTVESRLTEERRADGEAALASAAYIIEDFLQGLDPGYSIDTELDVSLMGWLSRVVSHQVNLYWQGQVSASSRPELFDAGLMPKRIPGEVYSRLGLAGEPIAARVNRTVPDVSYLELYGPLALPGGRGRSDLFLSVPLLAQEEAAAGEIRELTHQALIVTAFLVLLLLLVGARLAARFSQPLMQLVAGTDRIAQGATSLGLAPSEPELSALAEAIDDMAQRIHDARNHLLAEKQVVDAVVANINSAVVSLDSALRVQMCNQLARELLGVRVGEPLSASGTPGFAKPLSQLSAERPATLTRRTAKVQGPSGKEQEWTIVWVPVAGGGELAALVVVEDVTEILSGQRLAAWAEMARMIAHEVKNPLTPIRLSAEHLRRVHEQAPARLDEVFDRCIDNILEQVSELRETAAEFSTFSKIPSAALEPGDLTTTVYQVVDGYRSSPPEGVEIHFEAGSPHLRTSFDHRLIARAVRNLLENAVHASAADPVGGVVEVRVAVESTPDGDSELREAVITVADRGPGVPKQNLARIFEPNFSTSSGGTGLGLAITRRIAEQHGGKVSATNRKGGGLLVAFRFPLRRA